MNCYLVKDLLPNYIDGLVGEETEKDIQEHLRACHDCQIIYEQMKEPIAPVPVPADGKELNFLKKLKKKTIKNIIIVASILITVFCILAWIFAFGTKANSNDVTVKTEFQDVTVITEFQNEDIAHLNKEWVIHFNLTNGKALKTKNEYIYKEDENGIKTPTGCIITLYEVQPSSLFECSNYTYGYSQYGEETVPSNLDFTVTVRYRDKEVVYSMRDEGLFDLAE